MINPNLVNEKTNKTHTGKSVIKNYTSKCGSHEFYLKRTFKGIAKKKRLLVKSLPNITFCDMF